MKALPFYLSFFIPLSAFLGIHFGGAYLIATPIVVFILHPLLDAFVAPSRSIHTDDHFEFSIPIYLHFVLQLALIIYSLYEVAHGRSHWSQWVPMALSVGISTGSIGITSAHELIHRRARWQRAIGVGFLAMASYMHYRIEHVFGHHQNVATFDDPSTGRRGESIYAFWPRCIWGVYKSALKIEFKNRKGLSNRMIHYFVVQIAIFALIYFYAGLIGLEFFLLQSLVAILILEAVDYIEHYGLERKVNPNGRYEPATPLHTWDSDHRLTNWVLFNLGRHAHHHRKASDEYALLGVTENAKRFKHGYSTMVLLTLIPPLWKKVTSRSLE